MRIVGCVLSFPLSSETCWLISWRAAQVERQKRFRCIQIKSDNSAVCRRPPLFQPFDWHDVTASLAIIAVCFLSAASGIGGGGVLVPLYIMLCSPILGDVVGPTGLAAVNIMFAAGMWCCVRWLHTTRYRCRRRRLLERHWGISQLTSTSVTRQQTVDLLCTNTSSMPLGNPDEPYTNLKVPIDASHRDFSDATLRSVRALHVRRRHAP